MRLMLLPAARDLVRVSLQRRAKGYRRALILAAPVHASVRVAELLAR